MSLESNKGVIFLVEYEPCLLLYINKGVVILMEYEPCLLLENIQIDWPVPNSVGVYHWFEESVFMYWLACVSLLLACARVTTRDVGLFSLLIV